MDSGITPFGYIILVFLALVAVSVAIGIAMVIYVPIKNYVYNYHDIQKRQKMA